MNGLLFAWSEPFGRRKLLADAQWPLEVHPVMSVAIRQTEVAGDICSILCKILDWERLEVSNKNWIISSQLSIIFRYPYHPQECSFHSSKMDFAHQLTFSAVLIENICNRAIHTRVGSLGFCVIIHITCSKGNAINASLQTAVWE